MIMKSDFDLKKAFGAPPASYRRRTRATLASLEEGTQVKKVSYGAALAFACIVLMMAGGLAAGLSGAWRTDITAPPVQTYDRGGAPTSAARALDEGVDMTVDSALYDGHCLYVRVTWHNPAEYADSDYMLTLSVNGQQPELLAGWLTAGEESVYEFLGRCEEPEGGVLSVDIGDAERGRTVNCELKEHEEFSYYMLTPAHCTGMPAPEYGFAVGAEDFGYAELRYDASAEGVERLMMSALSLAEDGGARIASRADGEAYELSVLCAKLADSLTLSAEYADGGEVGMSGFDLTESDWSAPDGPRPTPGAALRIDSEGQFDGELLWLRVALGGGEGELERVSVNGCEPELLARHMRAAGDERVCDMLYRCAEADAAEVVIELDGGAPGLKLTLEAQERMERYRARAVEGSLEGWAVNGRGFGMAHLEGASDGAGLQPGEYGADAGAALGITASEQEGKLDVLICSDAGRLPLELALPGDAAAIALEPDDGVLDSAALEAKFIEAACGDGYVAVSYTVSAPGRRLYSGGAQDGGAVRVEPAELLVDGESMPCAMYMAGSESEDALNCLAIYECGQYGDSARLRLRAGADAVECGLEPGAESANIERLYAQVTGGDGLLLVGEPVVFRVEDALLVTLDYADVELTAGGQRAETAELDCDADWQQTELLGDGAGGLTGYRLNAQFYEGAGRDEIVLRRAAGGDAAPAATLRLMSNPLSVKGVQSDGRYTYVLAGVRAADGRSVRWSRGVDILLSALDECERGYAQGTLAQEEFDARVNALMGELSRLALGAEAEAVESPESSASMGIIGGADGPTSIYVNGGEEAAYAEPTDGSIAVIGGADGPTSIYVNGGTENAYAAPTDGSIAVIGGADGPTSIYVNGGEEAAYAEPTDGSIAVIGGADVPTSIYLNGDEEAAYAEPTYGSMAVIGGADGPTSIYVNGGTENADAEPTDGSAAVIGGADVPTGVYVSGGAAALMTAPRLTHAGRDVTLAVADVSGIVEHEPGETLLMLICDQLPGGAEAQVSCVLEGRELSAGLSAPAELNESSRSVRVFTQPEGMTITSLNMVSEDFTFVDGRYTLADGSFFGDGQVKEVLFDGGALGGGILDSLGEGALNITTMPARTYWSADGDAHFHTDAEHSGAQAQPISHAAAVSAGLEPCPDCVGPEGALVLRAPCPGAYQDAATCRLFAGESGASGGGRGFRLCQIVPARVDESMLLWQGTLRAGTLDCEAEAGEAQ